jgi:hypothetical protein
MKTKIVLLLGILLFTNCITDVSHAVEYVSVSGQLVNNSHTSSVFYLSLSISSSGQDNVVASTSLKNGESFNLNVPKDIPITIVLNKNNSIGSEDQIGSSQTTLGANWSTTQTFTKDSKLSLTVPMPNRINVVAVDGSGNPINGLVVDYLPEGYRSVTYSEISLGDPTVSWKIIDQTSSGQNLAGNQTTIYSYSTNNQTAMRRFRVLHADNWTTGNGSITWTSSALNVSGDLNIKACFPFNISANRSDLMCSTDQVEEIFNKAAADKAAADKAAADKAAADKAAADKAAADKAAADKAAADKAAADKAAADKAAADKKLVTCVKGKVVKKVVANGKCPSGYKKK